MTTLSPPGQKAEAESPTRTVAHDPFDGEEDEEDLMVYDDQNQDEVVGLMNPKASPTERATNLAAENSVLNVPFEALDKTEIIVMIVSAILVICLVLVGAIILAQD